MEEFPKKLDTVEWIRSLGGTVRDEEFQSELGTPLWIRHIKMPNGFSFTCLVSAWPSVEETVRTSIQRHGV